VEAGAVRATRPAQRRGAREQSTGLRLTWIKTGAQQQQ